MTNSHRYLKPRNLTGRIHQLIVVHSCLILLSAGLLIAGVLQDQIFLHAGGYVFAGVHVLAIGFNGWYIGVNLRTLRRLRDADRSRAGSVGVPGAADNTGDHTHDGTSPGAIAVGSSAFAADQRTRPGVVAKSGPAIGWRVWPYLFIQDPGRYNTHDTWSAHGWFDGSPAQCRNEFTHRRVAENSTRPYAIPLPGCTCGYYAYDSPSDQTVITQNQSITVYGVALGWGRVIKHEIGWRAQYGKPLCFIRLDSPHSPLARRYNRILGEVAAALDIPTLTMAQAEAMVSEWPMTQANEEPIWQS